MRDAPVLSLLHSHQSNRSSPPSFEEANAPIPNIDAPPFVYSALPSYDGWTRLLHLEPAAEVQSLLVANMTIVSLASSSLFSRAPKFNTLSFPSSPNNEKAPAPVIIDGHARYVTRHCELALRSARDTTHKRTLWVEELCINASDPDEIVHSEELRKKVFKKKKGMDIWNPPERPINNAYDYLWMDVSSSYQESVARY